MLLPLQLFFTVSIVYTQPTTGFICASHDQARPAMQQYSLYINSMEASLDDQSEISVQALFRKDIL